VLLAAGMLGWRMVREGIAQEPAAAGSRPFGLSYVPRDAVLVLATRPAELLRQPALASLRDSLANLGDDGPWRGIKPEDVTELKLIALLDERVQLTIAFTLRAASAEAATRLATYLGTNTESIRYGGTSYVRTQSAQVYFQPDVLSFVVASDEATLRRCILAGKAGAATTNWAERWSMVAERSAAAVVNTSLLRALPELAVSPSRGRMASTRSHEQLFRQTLAQATPLWQRSEWAVAELVVTEQITLRVVSQSASEENARQVHDALLTTVSAGRLGLALGRAEAVRADDPRGAALLQQLDLLDTMLEKAQIARQEKQVGLVARADSGLAQRLASMLLPAALATRDTNLRTTGANNLKLLALAMHNYHDTYKVFPAATQIGPKNVPHSWRVTILPFLEQAELYREYRQDEPWDSDHNRKALAKMPAVYRSPGDARTSTNTSYFTLVGPETPFHENKPGRLANIVDGTSNTILLVEAKQPTPWTKPEDIPFDSQQALPALGGWLPTGFMSAFCDGSVRFVPADIDPQTLRYAIMQQDGHSLHWPQ